MPDSPPYTPDIITLVYFYYFLLLMQQIKTAREETYKSHIANTAREIHTKFIHSLTIKGDRETNIAKVRGVPS